MRATRGFATAMAAAVLSFAVSARAASDRVDAPASLPRAALDPAPKPAPVPPSRARLNGQKYASPVGNRTEAGVVLSLDSHLSMQLNYARIAEVPLMPYANDNGILARLRFGF